jgi:uncharacterized cupredoxin-like copper-binding protein
MTNVFVAAAYAAILAASSGTAFAHGPGHDDSRESFSAGESGDPKKPFRVVVVSMREGDGKMMYVPDDLEVKKGEQIKFVIKNEGELDHEFMLASVKENAAHAKLMEKNPEMEHDDPNAKSIKSKGVAEILWRFSKPGSFEFACLVPGHYEAGMKGTVVVTTSTTASTH